eukprot:TRINITY_DN125404_c0_g1_i1.p1 TRINITY_DN125404_c0_g1~~TRINITY_DN125404_c0_g1_i1.p1  ORF type:complete len:138 (-),score=29.03 TRINITY_DN125404_c0_g1_i1:236-649(-)
MESRREMGFCLDANPDVSGACCHLAEALEDLQAAMPREEHIQPPVTPVVVIDVQDVPPAQGAGVRVRFGVRLEGEEATHEYFAEPQHSQPPQSSEASALEPVVAEPTEDSFAKAGSHGEPEFDFQPSSRFGGVAGGA